MKIKRLSFRFAIYPALILFSFPGLMMSPMNGLHPTKGGGRSEKRKITVMTRHWQLAKWSGGEQVCDLYIRHDNWPTPQEIGESCGWLVVNDWLSTPVCEAAKTGVNTGDCEGLFLRYIREVPKTYEEVVSLPQIEVQVAPYNCETGEWCQTRPSLEISATEPLLEYQVENIHIQIGGRDKVYKKQDIRINLPLTGEDGDWLIYWAKSSYGDRSEPVRLRYRSYLSRDGTSFRLDLLGEEWANSLPSGVLLWGLFNSAENTPSYLIQPDSPVDLYTTDSYLYLAGYLIQSGQVNTSSCTDGGLYLGGSASACGAEAAEAQVIDWQNRYNAQILQSAVKYNIPALLLKRIIAQESQFMPVSNNPYEKGLGYLTSDGADMLLTWNTDYYLESCQSVFRDYICAGGYGSLGEYRQTLLRKFILDKIGTPEEFDVLAATIFASAAQSGQMVKNIAQEEPFYASTYTDMWKISVGNYYGGAGCLSEAMQALKDEREDMTWGGISSNLSDECLLTNDYVEKVMEE